MKKDESDANHMGFVRVAMQSDVGQMIEIFRIGFDRDLLEYTILGCHGYAQYVIDHLSDEHHLFVVYVENNCVEGAAEFRREATSIFVNHIYVRASQRGKGIGRTLLAQGINLARNHGQIEIGLDVFSDNSLAARWYESLGFISVTEKKWYRVLLLPGVSDERFWWRIENLEIADRKHAIYGFSQFNLVTLQNSYLIGRMGADYFRFVNSDNCAEELVCRALFEFDSHRKLVVIGTPIPCLGEFKMLKTSFRLRAEIDGVLERIKKSL